MVIGTLQIVYAFFKQFNVFDRTLQGCGIIQGLLLGHVDSGLVLNVTMYEHPPDELPSCVTTDLGFLRGVDDHGDSDVFSFDPNSVRAIG
jgi:hypothetical protein